MRPLAEGEQILLIDKVGRRYRVRLKAGERHSMHSGLIEHDVLIGIASCAPGITRVEDHIVVRPRTDKPGEVK